MRSRSESWTDPGFPAVLSQVADIGLAKSGNCDPKHCSAYKVAVLWSRVSDKTLEDEKSGHFRYSTTSPDILLRAEAPNMHPEDELIYPRLIEVTIDGTTGNIRSIVCNGFVYLRIPP